MLFLVQRPDLPYTINIPALYRAHTKRENATILNSLIDFKCLKLLSLCQLLLAGLFLRSPLPTSSRPIIPAWLCYNQFFFSFSSSFVLRWGFPLDRKESKSV